MAGRSVENGDRVKKGQALIQLDTTRLGKDLERVRAQLVDDYEQKFNNPYVAAEHGLVDDVIEPRETRPRLIRALEVLRNKRENLPPKKHGNIPL